jgi:hypothetical protein
MCVDTAPPQMGEPQLDPQLLAAPVGNVPPRAQASAGGPSAPLQPPLGARHPPELPDPSSATFTPSTPSPSAHPLSTCALIAKRLVAEATGVKFDTGSEAGSEAGHLQYSNSDGAGAIARAVIKTPWLAAAVAGCLPTNRSEPPSQLEVDFAIRYPGVPGSDNILRALVEIGNLDAHARDRVVQQVILALARASHAEDLSRAPAVVAAMRVLTLTGAKPSPALSVPPTTEHHLRKLKEHVAAHASMQQQQQRQQHQQRPAHQVPFSSVRPAHAQLGRVQFAAPSTLLMVQQQQQVAAAAAVEFLSALKGAAVSGEAGREVHSQIHQSGLP